MAMTRLKLSDSEWQRLLSKLRAISGIRIGVPIRCQRFVEAVLWVLRTGAQWRTLPAAYGRWNSVFKRFSRWSQLAVWGQVLNDFAQEADLQQVCIDSTIARAHACAAGAGKDSAEREALGRSRGGFSCKIHALTDSLGLPLKFILTGGQAADISQALPLLQGVKADALLADKGYDADALLAWAQANQIEAVIPAKANRKVPRECDWWLYKERHVVECMFGKLKHYRRIFSRFEKTMRNFMEMLSFAATLLWLR
jgi:transposase